MYSQLFSIVIPNYNSEKFIIRTLQSLKDQTYQDFELILVDDHSTDNSYQLAEKYLVHSTLKYQIVKRPGSLPKGVSSCRNYGIRLSGGEWICFLDSDDVFLTDKLQVLHDFINTQKNLLAIHHNVKLIGEDGNDIEEERKTPVKTQFSELVHGNTIVTSSVAVSKMALKETGHFDPGLHGVEDYLLWLKMANRYGWYYIDVPLAGYRVRNDSLMGARRLSHYVNENNKLYKTALRELDFEDTDQKAFKRNLFFRTMRYYVSISLRTYGYKDFLNGIGSLILCLRFHSAFHFLYIIHKRKLVRYLSQLKRFATGSTAS